MSWDARLECCRRGVVVCGSVAADADANGSELMAVLAGSLGSLLLPVSSPLTVYGSDVVNRSVPAVVVLDGLRAFGRPTLLSAFVDWNRPLDTEFGWCSLLSFFL